MSRPVLVGDRKWDVIGGSAVGIPVIGVEWGYTEEGELNGIVEMVGTPEELVALLTGDVSAALEPPRQVPEVGCCATVGAEQRHG